MIAVQQQRDALKVMTNMADMALQEQMLRRDAIVEAARQEFSFLDGHKEASTRLLGNTAQAIRGYKGF
jgi:hypothetical protein